MATEKQYWERVKAIDSAWNSIRKIGQEIYLTDANVDSENSSHCEFQSPEYWDSMLVSLDMSVAMRLEEMGISWKLLPIALNY